MLFHSRVELDAGACSIVEQEAPRAKKWYFECVLSRCKSQAAKCRIRREMQ